MRDNGTTGRRDHGTKSGFSLLEMIAVLAIIFFLVALLIGVSKYANRAAKENAARSDIQRIGNVLQDYFVERGRYPSSLRAVSNDLTETVTRWANDEPLDPWHNPYCYRPETNSEGQCYSYTLFSCGKDGRAGSSNTDADNITVSGK